MKKIIFILLLPINSFAAFIGNIAEPNLYNQGLISSSNSIGIRSSYVYDNIYKGRYKDRFQTINSTPTDTKLITQGGLIALSFFKWIDIYGMAGESKFQLDQLIFTNNCFSWAIGSKCLLFKWNNFYSGIDIKYFYSNQKSDYFLIDQEVAMLQTPITMEYTEIQGALGFAYKVIPYFIPYIGVSYLYSNLNPQPSVGILQIPKTTTYTDFETSTAVTRKNWGMFIGTSFISTDTVSISIENRMFNQNAFNLIGSIKF